MENQKIRSGTLEDYLLKNEKNNLSKVVKEGTKNSKLASLDYEVLKYNEEINLSLLKINLHTGRHHQIRVQLSSRNHSIYGDQKYGTRGRGKQIALWAYKLEIIHPITKEKMVFTTLPEMNGSWKILEEQVDELFAQQKLNEKFFFSIYGRALTVHLNILCEFYKMHFFLYKIYFQNFNKSNVTFYITNKKYVEVRYKITTQESCEGYI